MHAASASSRWAMRANTPTWVRPPWRSRLSWSLTCRRPTRSTAGCRPGSRTGAAKLVVLCHVGLLDHAVDGPRVATRRVRGHHRNPVIRHTGQRTTRWDCRGAVDSTCADLVPRQVAGIFLFLTYYFQLTLAYSAVKSGLAFLPMVAAIVVASTTCSGV